MDVDSKLLIFDNLNLEELVSIAVTNKHFLGLAQLEFASKYSKKTIKIDDPYINARLKFTYKENVIHIHDYMNVLNVLKYFGHLITKLEVRYSESHSFSPVDIQEISKMISLYCSDSLKHFTVDSFQTQFFNNLKKPFTKVEEVSVRGWFYSLESYTLYFNELFPVMRRLTLKYIRILLTNSIEREFKQLEHISIDVSPGLESEHHKQINIENVIKKNPQIRSFTLGSGHWQLLTTVNQILPNIENLELINHDQERRNSDGQQEILFRNVIDFAYMGSQNLPKYLTFQKLSDFHLEAFPKRLNDMIEFVKRNQNLKKMFIDKGYFTEDEYNTLTTTHWDLNEISFSLFDLSDQNILNLIRNNENMQIIQISRNQSLKSITNILNAEYGDKWIITDTDLKMVIKCRNTFN